MIDRFATMIQQLEEALVAAEEAGEHAIAGMVCEALNHARARLATHRAEAEDIATLVAAAGQDEETERAAAEEALAAGMDEADATARAEQKQRDAEAAAAMAAAQAAHAGDDPEAGD